MNKINHLAGIKSQFVDIERLRMHVLTAGNSTNPSILFLHGNTSSSTIWEEFMLDLSGDYFCVAPDLRGFGETDDSKIIDATKGTENWSDDLAALARVMQLPPFHLVGHSLGGFVCWGIIAKHASMLRTATLIAPGPPMGFGGLHGKEGKPNNEDFSGSGGGIVVKEFADRIEARDRSVDHPFYSPRNAMNRLFWKEGFKARREEDFLTAMLNIHFGDKKYPGDWVSSNYWPGVAPGKFGPVNAMSPKYNQNVFKELLAVDQKPPLLWIQGTDDHIISDQSYSDPGFQGKLNLREKWPGEDVFPPQPLFSQVEYVLEQYAFKRGEIRKKMITDCGHTPFIEKPKITKQAILGHLER
ncbi:MAG TPA: alpha/beta hydrolase [Balneolaceae bacterium]|nr:alpha/beta hydrolase [Balneolaceae bacterium]